MKVSSCGLRIITVDYTEHRCTRHLPTAVVLIYSRLLSYENLFFVDFSHPLLLQHPLHIHTLIKQSFYLPASCLLVHSLSIIIAGFQIRFSSSGCLSVAAGMHSPFYCTSSFRGFHQTVGAKTCPNVKYLLDVTHVSESMSLSGPVWMSNG